MYYIRYCANNYMSVVMGIDWQKIKIFFINVFNFKNWSWPSWLSWSSTKSEAQNDVVGTASPPSVVISSDMAAAADADNTKVATIIREAIEITQNPYEFAKIFKEKGLSAARIEEVVTNDKGLLSKEQIIGPAFNFMLLMEYRDNNAYKVLEPLKILNDLHEQNFSLSDMLEVYQDVESKFTADILMQSNYKAQDILHNLENICSYLGDNQEHFKIEYGKFIFTHKQDYTLNSLKNIQDIENSVDN